MTAVTLATIWPIQPRITLGKGTYYEIVGITPDSKELITLTERAIPSPNGGYFSYASGPIVLWNLGTGDHRTICIPGQSCDGDLVESGNDEGLRMVEPDEKVVDWRGASIRGQWLFFNDSVLDCRSGHIRQLDEDRLIEPSAGGRWYTSFVGHAPRRYIPTVPTSMRICETATGREQLSVECDTGIRECFSRDDEYFAYTTIENEHGVTRIWRLDPPTLVWTIARDLHGLAFSNDHRLLAGCSVQQNAEGQDLVRQFLVLDVQTGAVVNRLDLVEERDVLTTPPERKLLFADHDKRLLVHNLWNHYDGEGPYHANLNLNLVWNLETGEHTTYSDLDSNRIYDPSRSENGSEPDFPSQFLKENSQEVSEIRDVATGRKLGEIPDESECVLMSRNGQTMILESMQVSKVTSWVMGTGIPIPWFVLAILPQDAIRWSVVDIPSGKTLATIPEQNGLAWLSPDQQTLVTKSPYHTPPVISVWDFPPRKPLLKPITWSLSVPAIMLLWSRIRTARTRARKPA